MLSTIVPAFVFIFMVCFVICLGATAIVQIFYFVPYVPSRAQVVRTMIRAAHLKPKQTVYDLGSGDGRILIEAEKKADVKTIGYEIAPLPYLLSKIRALLARSKAQILFRNFFNVPLRRADVIFCYLFPHIMPRLATKIKKECKRGTRVISNTFSIPGLRLIRTLKKNPAEGLPTIYVYEV